MSFKKRDPQKGDGFFSVEVSEDGLKAYGEFLPPVGKGLPLIIDQVEVEFHKHNISYNIDWYTIHKTISVCNHEHKIVNGVLVAMGQPPVPYIPDRFIVEDTYLHSKPVAGKKSEHGKMDLRERKPFILVKIGDVIGRRVAGQEGKEGVNVQGEPIAIPTTDLERPSLGNNIVEKDGVLIATADGQLLFDEKKIEVSNTLVLHEGIGYETGHIRFPGDCILYGELNPGFKVILGGDFFAKNSLEVTEIFCKKKIMCEGGFLGHGSGVVRAKERIGVRFVENCLVECCGPIYIKRSVLHGKVHSRDRILIGEQSRVIGSELTAAKGVYAFSLGSEQGEPAVVRTGIDFATERQIESFTKHVDMLAKKIADLKALLEMKDSESGQIRLQGLLEEQFALQEKAALLLPGLDVGENSIIAVKDKIYAGTKLQICRAYYDVTRTEKGVQFKLDMRTGFIVKEKLEIKNLPVLRVSLH